MPTFRIAEVDVAENDEALEINLELLEEKREQAAIRESKSKRQMEKYYNTKVRNASFKPGDLVYLSNEASHAEDTRKLGPKWEGPYEISYQTEKIHNIPRAGILLIGKLLKKRKVQVAEITDSRIKISLHGGNIGFKIS
ncbi:hypothetical protein Tco_0165222 [Tanacetum coccineum]